MKRILPPLESRPPHPPLVQDIHPNARILVIEDDPDIRRALEHDLALGGFEVILAPSGSLGLLRARETEPQLILLDLTLPDFDGLEVARRLRRFSSVPLIVLSGRDSLEDKLRLLGAGADDYLVKPFHTPELMARIGVQMRRSSGEDTVQVGALRFDVLSRQCTFGGVPVPLSPTEMNILLLLARSPGRVFSRQEIIKVVWPSGLPEGSNVLDVHIANARAKLREIGAFGVLRTIRGLGYALRVPPASGTPDRQTPAPRRSIS
ncbi:DNA-binding response OmpR family regulator [Deinobacterium chartae]|uniref:DNA-binding response OmpR family regulator n=1 Tax=Deinobacterium chartae TaxID=521158 RepID=A0A841HY22_9DEIO|nr:response regulator transcription factor [Deinobacterium chartae]MBB6096822.1 DNA-binding response OmpR family regulator [Deinobacterium chartae]